MSNDLPAQDILQSLNKIVEGVERNTNLLHELLRRGKGEKTNALIERVREVGRITTKQACAITGSSKPWTLNLMRRAGELPGFTFMPGDGPKQRSACLIFNASKVYRDQLAIVKELISPKENFDRKEGVTLSEVMSHCAVEIQEARMILSSFVSTNPEFELFGPGVRRR